MQTNLRKRQSHTSCEKGLDLQVWPCKDGRVCTDFQSQYIFGLMTCLLWILWGPVEVGLQDVLKMASNDLVTIFHRINTRTDLLIFIFFILTPRIHNPASLLSSFGFASLHCLLRSCFFGSCFLAGCFLGRGRLDWFLRFNTLGCFRGVYSCLLLLGCGFWSILLKNKFVKLLEKNVSDSQRWFLTIFRIITHSIPDDLAKHPSR